MYQQLLALDIMSHDFGPMVAVSLPVGRCVRDNSHHSVLQAVADSLLKRGPTTLPEMVAAFADRSEMAPEAMDAQEVRLTGTRHVVLQIPHYLHRSGTASWYC